MDTIIVSRHPAAIEFIARQLGGQTATHQGKQCIEIDVTHPDDIGTPEHYACQLIPIVAQATAADVRGKHIYGNLPLHLAALAAKVTVVEFDGAPPRGQEYSLEDMQAAGAVLRTYVVHGRSTL